MNIFNITQINVDKKKKIVENYIFEYIVLKVIYLTFWTPSTLRLQSAYKQIKKLKNSVQYDYRATFLCFFLHEI